MNISTGINSKSGIGKIKFLKQIEMQESENLKLLDGITITDSITPAESIQLEKILIENDLSTFAYNKSDFLIMKNTEGELIGAGRIYKLPLDFGNWGGDNYELSSIWVDENFRGYGLGTIIVESLLEKFHIENHEAIDRLFLATKRELEQFYGKHGFVPLEYGNYPKKFEETMKWAKSQKLDAVVMKYSRDLKKTA